MIHSLQRLYHTIKHLRFEQIAYRIWYKLRPSIRLTHTAIRPLSPFKERGKEGDFALHGEPSFLSETTVSFLNTTSSILTPSDWNATDKPKLWLYNLHYFDDLNTQDDNSRLALQCHWITRWIQENPVMRGVGWEPYTLSLRIVNWIKWITRHHPDPHLQKAGFCELMIESLGYQAEALSKQLEYHILGNHLFENGKALLFAGCFLEGTRATHYFKTGLKILKREIPEQFLSDGAHFERSTMYQSILICGMLDLYQLAKITKHPKLAPLLPQWENVIQKGIDWLSDMTHPDGEVSFFNDSAMGIAPKLADIVSYATALDIKTNGGLGASEEKFPSRRPQNYINAPPLGGEEGLRRKQNPADCKEEKEHAEEAGSVRDLGCPAESFQKTDSRRVGDEAPRSTITQPNDTPLIKTLLPSGYTRITALSHSLFFDHAKVGPDYQPGHAHADTLSVEWSVGLERVLVNSGTSTYETGAERLRQRKTASHNTVVLNGEDSSEVWSSFRVARRANAEFLDSKIEGDTAILIASHDGYTRLKKGIIHQRKITATTNSISIHDSVSPPPTPPKGGDVFERIRNFVSHLFNLNLEHEGKRRSREARVQTSPPAWEGVGGGAIAYYHLHPDILVNQTTPTMIYLTLKSGQKICVTATSPMTIAATTWHPRFYESIPNQKLVIPFTGEELTVSFRCISE